MASTSQTTETLINHGHSFIKKKFHRPIYCHICTEIIWIGKGMNTCEVCNLVVHDRCLNDVFSLCTNIAVNLVKNPVAHSWTLGRIHKKKFCNVCRKRMAHVSIHCELCEYYVHVECQDFAIPNCRNNATCLPGRTLSMVSHPHHWREGNLPKRSKCVVCNKNCYTSECLAGLRCVWCGTTSHTHCYKKISKLQNCMFGHLESIYLPPYAVSIPRKVPAEDILGLRLRNKKVARQSISEEFDIDDPRHDNGELQGSTHGRHPRSSKEEEDRGDEEIEVYDGNKSLRQRIFQIISVPRKATTEQVLTLALRKFYITEDPSNFYLTDLYAEETELCDPTPILNLNRKKGKRPAICLRFKDNDSREVRVYAGRLYAAKSFCVVRVDKETTIATLVTDALRKFDIRNFKCGEIKCSQILLNHSVTERILSWEERPWDISKRIGKESIKQMHLMRFQLQLKEDFHQTDLTLYVANLPHNLSEKSYENILTGFLGEENKFSSIGPIYYEYGSVIIRYEELDTAIKALYKLRETKYNDKHLLAIILSNIDQNLIPMDVQPLLVFVNVKSGGCQGLQLISSFRKLLNPYQVFDLDNGGPLPGLYSFRNVKNYKILVCGGDGTIGWVLQCLDNVGQESECASPGVAIVPLGTGNDLARVLSWGSGYTGDTNPINLLRDVIDAEEITLDRWTVCFYPEKKDTQAVSFSSRNAAASKQVTSRHLYIMGTGLSEENSQIYVMNNYFGFGIDADLCLDFHNAREENPSKFKSRIRNKGMYVTMGVHKTMARPKPCKDLYKEIRLEVDDKVIELPQVEGIIILNISSWGSGANPWGLEREDGFYFPSHWDGMLEVVGVTGVMHLGQIQSGLRTAIRLAQGSHIKIHLNSDVPVQIDGEPWIQCPSEIVILKSAVKATMLKKTKSKTKRQLEQLPILLNDPDED